MNQYQICDVTKSQMDNVCTFPQCLTQCVEINCHKCLVNLHKHDQPNNDHIISFYDIQKQSKRNIEIAIERLKSFYKADQNEISFQEKINKLISTISDIFHKILKRINEVMIGRFQKIEEALKKPQEELNKLNISNIDFENKEQIRKVAFLAISTQENILPNLDLLNVKIDDIKDLLREIESTIINLNQFVEPLIENYNESFEIKLYTPQIREKYANCQIRTHKECLIEYICITCNDMVLGCKLCMNSKHPNHKLIQQEQYKKNLAANQSSFATIRKDQINSEREWQRFIKNKTIYFQNSLTMTINEQLLNSFQVIQARQNDSIYCQETQSTFYKISSDSQNQITNDVSQFLRDISSKIKIFKTTIEIKKKPNITQVDYFGKDQMFSEDNFKKAVKIIGDYLFIITDIQDNELFNFEVNKADIKVTQKGTDIQLGSKDNENQIKFKLNQFYYKLDEVKIKGELKLEKQSQILNQNMKYKWKWIIFKHLV